MHVMLSTLSSSISSFYPGVCVYIFWFSYLADVLSSSIPKTSVAIQITAMTITPVPTSNTFAIFSEHFLVVYVKKKLIICTIFAVAEIIS